MSESKNFDPKSLADLLAKVQAATGPDTELDWAVTQWADPGAVRYSSAHQHYTASVDSALALVEKLLPGWTVSIYSAAPGTWMIDDVPTETVYWDVDLYAPGAVYSPADDPPPSGDGPTLPLAILSALLSSLKAST